MINNRQKIGIKAIKSEVNEDKVQGIFDNIVIAKYSTLNAIAAYMQETNTFFICEELIESSQLEKLIDIDYFSARTLDDVLNHEIGGYKKHWEQAKKLCMRKKLHYKMQKTFLMQI